MRCQGPAHQEFGFCARNAGSNWFRTPQSAQDVCGQGGPTDVGAQEPADEAGVRQEGGQGCAPPLSRGPGSAALGNSPLSAPTDPRSPRSQRRPGGPGCRLLPQASASFQLQLPHCRLKTLSIFRTTEGPKELFIWCTPATSGSRTRRKAASATCPSPTPTQCGGQRRPWHTDDRHCDRGAPASLQAGEGQLAEEGLLPEVSGAGVPPALRPAVPGAAGPGRPRVLRQAGTLPGSGLQGDRPVAGARAGADTQPACHGSRPPGAAGRLGWDGPVPVDTHPSSSCFLRPQNLLPAPVVLTSTHELDLFRCFRPVLAHVQLLWELMLLGEPLLVLAPSPAVSSEMVLALARWVGPPCERGGPAPALLAHGPRGPPRSCLQPLKFCCDYRPYFTVHDSEFKEFSTRTQAPPNVVLGVTNPFFIKTLQHWPHILRVGEPKMSGEAVPASTQGSWAHGALRGLNLQTQNWPGHGACLVGDLPKQVKLKKPSRLKTLDTKPGLYTAYTAHLHRDKALLRRLLKGLQKKRPSDAQTAVLRRHLLELTQSFIIPLEHYMASLMPLQKSIAPWKTPPQIRPFRQDDFLRSLEHAGPQLTCVLKGDWLGLYRPARGGCLLPPNRRFFKSPHFDGWYRQRHKEMAQKLEALHLEAICEAVRGLGGGAPGREGTGPEAGEGLGQGCPLSSPQNIEIWMKDKSEVEVVDLVLKLQERLVRAQGHQLPVKEATLKRARLYIETVIGSLPKDLQVVLCPP
ncbi:protein DENND6B isoform X16 [Hippopotamus amphibius kiboko]|uniref:protein DENND6B isoform X16 n=1 Tax=Hippopotamus amphibius kiboko TaxID=575201 RepID=UPI002594055F|nr:protein DENND6B isoform X16 [Hippopotamus amphibius kiboko]